MAEEFRVFLPDLHNQDYWIPQQQQREYWAAIRTVLEAAAAVVDDADVEKRADVYSVVNDSVGLKLRVSAARVGRAVVVGASEVCGEMCEEKAEVIRRICRCGACILLPCVCVRFV